MTNEEALDLIGRALKKVTGRTWGIGPETNLIADDLLDSLDSMVFILELEKSSGKNFPEADLEEEKFYTVKKLVDFLVNGEPERFKDS